LWRVEQLVAVIPAKTGLSTAELVIHFPVQSRSPWIPGFAGMTAVLDDRDLHVRLTDGRTILPARADKDLVKVERVGGLAGFGGPRLKSAGEVAMSALSAADRKAIEAMFRVAARAGAGKPDGFVYRITMSSGGVTKTVDVSGERVPEAIRKCVKSTLK
jgi:hypothetical protein